MGEYRSGDGPQIEVKSMAPNDRAERATSYEQLAADFRGRIIRLARGIDGFTVPNLEQYDEAVALRRDIHEEAAGDERHFYGPNQEEIPWPYMRLIVGVADRDWRLDSAGATHLQKVVDSPYGEDMEPAVLDQFLAQYHDFADEEDIAVRFREFQGDARRHLELSEELYRREYDTDPPADPPSKKRWLGALALKGRHKTFRKAASSEIGPPSEDGRVAVKYEAPRHRRTPEKRKKRRTIVGIAAALGLTAVAAGLGVHYSDQGTGTAGPEGAQTARTEPTSIISARPSATPTPHKTTQLNPAEPGKPGIHIQPHTLHQPVPSDVRPGDRPWNTLHRLGIPDGQIMRALNHAAKVSHHRYRWHGSGTQRWIEVDGSSGTRHVMAVLGPYITLG